MTDYSDLVKRLRYGYVIDYDGKGQLELVTEAANYIDKQTKRIERLEAALRAIADIEKQELFKPLGEREAELWIILTKSVDVARAALEGKKND